jgi:branched-chain amino acid transport system substrate-binding protein
MTSLSRRRVLQLAGASSFLGVGSSIAQSPAIIKFGGSLGMSGRFAETGTNVHLGYQTAVKFLNDELGGVDIGGRRYKFALNIVDDASDPSRASALVQRLLDQGTDFFLGSYGSNVVLPSAGITEAAGKVTVQIGGSADNIFTAGYKNIFGFFPRASRAWETTVDFFGSAQPRIASMTVIQSNDAFSKLNAQAVVKGAKEKGIQVLDVITLPESISDASTALASLRARTPDLLITTTVEQNSLAIARQMQASNTTVRLLYQFLGPELPVYRESLGQFSEGVLYYVPWDPVMNFSDPFFGDSRKYLAYYQKNSQRPFTYHTVGASACVTTYVRAMQLARSIEPQAVRDALASIDYTSIYGRVKFSPGGDADPVAMGPKVGQIQGKKTEIVYPNDLATSKLMTQMPVWKKA